MCDLSFLRRQESTNTSSIIRSDTAHKFDLDRLLEFSTDTLRDRSQELAKFKSRFNKADLDEFLDLLLEGEDLLVSVVGKERYDSYHIETASILNSVAEASVAGERGDTTEAKKTRSVAAAQLEGLKARIRGI